MKKINPKCDPNRYLLCVSNKILSLFKFLKSLPSLIKPCESCVWVLRLIKFNLVFLEIILIKGINQLFYRFIL